MYLRGDPATWRICQIDPMFSTILRVGEVLALRRSDVDLTHRMLHVGASMSRREGIRSAKGDSERTIPMPQDFAERLREHLSNNVASIEDWLLVSPRARQLRYTNWRSRVWDRCRRCRHSPPQPKTHGRATRLFTVDGWSVPLAQAFFGHADPKVTLSIYTHVAAEELPRPSSVDTLWTPTALAGESGQ